MVGISLLNHFIDVLRVLAFPHQRVLLIQAHSFLGMTHPQSLFKYQHLFNNQEHHHDTDRNVAQETPQSLCERAHVQ